MRKANYNDLEKFLYPVISKRWPSMKIPIIVKCIMENGDKRMRSALLTDRGPQIWSEKK